MSVPATPGDTSTPGSERLDGLQALDQLRVLHMEDNMLDHELVR